MPTVSRPPLLELTLFVTDPAASAAFYQALGFHAEPCPDSEAVDVVLGDTTLQLFPANPRHPISHCQLGFQVPDAVVAAEGLTRLGWPWECPGPNRLVARDPDGNRVHLLQGIREPDR